MTELENIASDSATDGKHETFDPACEPASDAVVSALSTLTGTAVDELESFESVVDPIVFDALVRRHRRPIRVQFVYHDHEVTVDSGGEIWIEPQQEGSSQ